MDMCYTHGRRSRGGEIWSGWLSSHILSCCKILSTRLLALQCRKMCFCLYSRTFIVSSAMRAPPRIPVRSTPMAIHSLLPPNTEHSYLRRRWHDYELIAKTRTLNINNFIIRMLYKKQLLTYTLISYPLNNAYLSFIPLNEYCIVLLYLNASLSKFLKCFLTIVVLSLWPWSLTFDLLNSTSNQVIFVPNCK